VLNARKEELYNREDLKEFGSMSPVKKLAHQGLKLMPIHPPDSEREKLFGDLPSCDNKLRVHDDSEIAAMGLDKGTSPEQHA
jgi:hypothetical protein